MQREEIIFTEDESKKQDSSVEFEGIHSSNDQIESEDNNFLADQGSIGLTPPAFYLLFLR